MPLGFAKLQGFMKKYVSKVKTNMLKFAYECDY